MRKKIAVLFLAVSMIVSSLGTTAMADITGAGAGAEIDIISDVVNPIYKVVLPTDYSFALDAFEQTDAGTMISSSDFYFINKSNVAVQLNVAMKIAAADGVTLDIKDTKAEVIATDDTKQLWFGAVASTASLTTETTDEVALETSAEEAIYSYETDPVTYGISSVSGTAITFTDTTGVDGAYGTFADLDDTDASVVTVGTSDALMSFALAKANCYTLDDGSKVTAAVADSDAGVTALRFIGAVNSNATWADSDVTATVKYTLAGKSDTSYTALTDTDDTDGYAAITGAHALVKKLDSTSDVPTESITVSGTVSQATGGTFIVANVGTSDTITAVQVTDGVAPQNLLSAAYTYNASTGAFTLVAAKPWFALVGPNCTLKVTFATAGDVSTTFTK